MGVNVSIINASTAVTDAEAQAAVKALQTQVGRDFTPAWGTYAALDFVPKGHNPPAGHWWLTILDNSDVQGALGYHDLTNEGLPIGKIFAGTDKQYGTSWTVTASHELLEMLGDPDINLTTMVDVGGNKHTLYSVELCDPCEDDSFGYLIHEVLVSDFVLPSYFETFWAKNATRFDFKNHISSPFSLLKGGYLSEYNFTGGGWTQITDSQTPKSFASRARVGSRRERRRTPRSEWLRSTAHSNSTGARNTCPLCGDDPYPKER